MDIDRADSGIELTIRIPRIGQSGGGQDDARAEPYIVVAARGNDCAQALENLQWCKDNCPNAKDIDLWDLRLNVSTADSKEDIDRCFEILGSVEKRSGRDTDQYFIKAHADLLWKAGEKDQAKEKYRWLRENSNDGLILMDIAENNRIQSDKGDR
jgi:hypothetical protein